MRISARRMLMALIDTTCPICAAPHAKKLSVIYRDGLSTSAGSFSSVGTLNTIGQQQITTIGTTNESHQTEASKAAAPPAVTGFVSRGQNRRTAISIIGTVLSIVIGALVMLMDTFFNGILVASPIFLIGFLAAYAVDVTAKDGELEEHNRLFAREIAAYEEWTKTFCCQSCNHRFQPSVVTDD